MQLSSEKVNSAEHKQKKPEDTQQQKELFNKLEELLNDTFLEELSKDSIIRNATNNKISNKNQN